MENLLRKAIIFTFFCALLVLPLLGQAQYVPQPIEFDPGREIQGETQLGNASPVDTTARIINWALTLLGLICLVLILYGGFLWMTAGGNEERVGKAKKILGGAIIGLVIILASYGITAYVFENLVEATYH